MHAAPFRVIGGASSDPKKAICCCSMSSAGRRLRPNQLHAQWTLLSENCRISQRVGPINTRRRPINEGLCGVCDSVLVYLEGVHVAR
jgi:hypothetical protein